MRKARLLLPAVRMGWDGRGKLRSRTVAVAVVAAILAGFSAAGPVAAAQVTSRTALQAMLGGLGATEDFEALDVGAPAVWIDCPALNDLAICNGQGPGLVAPGVTFTFPAGQPGQWNDAGYWGAPSKELLTGFPDASGFRPILSIDFTGPVTAFGLDLREFAGFYDTATLHVYGSDDTTEVGSFSVALSGTPEFAGWVDSAGIGRVTIQGTETWIFWSPIIDNLEFGVALGDTAYASMKALTTMWVAKSGVAAQLNAYLDAAQFAETRGNLKAEAGNLESYRKLLEAQTGKAVDPSNAQQLIDWSYWL